MIAAYDFHQRRVPNWLALLGAIVAVIALALGVQPFGLAWPEATLGAAAGFSFLLIFYVTGVMGAGDVKFGGVLGMWVGIQPLLPIWIVASILAGAHAVFWLLLQRTHLFPRLSQALSGRPMHGNGSASTQKRQRHIPFAAYLAIAAAGWLFRQGLHA